MKRKGSRMSKRKNKKIDNTGYGRKILRWTGRVIVFSVLISGTVFGFIRLSDPATLPIRSVQIEGTFKHLDVAEIQHAVSKYADRGFLGLDIQDIQNEVKAIGWVDQVSVRRVWPDTVRIRVREHAPIARWKNNGLVNERGEWFDAEQNELVKTLPGFSGPEGHSLKMTEHYREFNSILNSVGLKIESLTMDQRRTWEVRLGNGIEIKLGKEKAGFRLKRFVRVYPLLLAQLSAGLSLESKLPIEALTSRMGGIDLRYTNGFSIRWQRNSSLPLRGTEKNV